MHLSAPYTPLAVSPPGPCPHATLFISFIYRPGLTLPTKGGVRHQGDVEFNRHSRVACSVGTEFPYSWEITLAMLAESGSSKSFRWDDYYTTASDIERMMSTRTCRGWMSPNQCVPGRTKKLRPWWGTL